MFVFRKILSTYWMKDPYVTLSMKTHYADNKLYTTRVRINLFQILKQIFIIILSWLKINLLKANPVKFHLMILRTNEKDSLALNIGKNKIKSSTEIILSWIEVEKKLKFKDSHWTTMQIVLPQVALRKIRKCFTGAVALCKVRMCFTGEKAKLLAKAFINSQFSYGTLVRMFLGKTSVAKICKIYFWPVQPIELK